MKKISIAAVPGSPEACCAPASMSYPNFVSALHWPRHVRGILLAAVLAPQAVLITHPARADDLSDVKAAMARGDQTAALRVAERAAVANPRNAQLRFLYGVVLMDLSRDAQALTVFGELMQEYPELPDPPNNIALIHARNGRLELARQALETALRNDPHHRTARVNLGQVYLMLAAQTWEQAAAAGPMDGSVLRQLEAVKGLLAVPVLATK